MDDWLEDATPESESLADVEAGLGAEPSEPNIGPKLCSELHGSGGGSPKKIREKNFLVGWRSLLRRGMREIYSIDCSSHYSHFYSSRSWPRILERSSIIYCQRLYVYVFERLKLEREQGL